MTKHLFEVTGRNAFNRGRVIDVAESYEIWIVIRRQGLQLRALLQGYEGFFCRLSVLQASLRWKENRQGCPRPITAIKKA